MDGGVRSGGPSEVVVKNRNSSGCLIVRRKGDASAGGHGSSGSRKVYESKKDEKRRRPVLSDSGSSDELLAAPRRRLGSDTIAVCRDLGGFGKGVEHNGEGHFVNSNGLDGSDRKRAKLDVFEFDEYDSVDGERSQMTYYDERGVAFKGRRFSGPTQMGRSGNDREYEAGPSRHIVDKRRNDYVERMSSVNRGNQTDKSRFTGHSDQAIRLQGKNGVLKVLVNKKKGVSEPLKKYKLRAEQHLKAPRMEESAKKKVLTPLYSAEQEIEKLSSVVKSEKRTASLRKSYPARNTKSSNWDSENSDGSLKREPENVLAVQSLKRVSLEGEDTPILASKSKDGKIKRGSGTEKQKLREKIRGMLVDAGWTIDYRPRRNRDYLDAVYINPLGTAYWSIIKAYDAFQKQLNDDVKVIKPTNDGSSLRLIADEDLCQLTRKTRKKIEKEMKRKQREGSDSERRSTIKKLDSDSMDSASHDEKLSSFIKQGGKSFKNRNMLDTIERAGSGSNSHGRKSKKLGRCTLLVRSSKKGMNSETDGFVPYTGKRTVLSWLIESGVVQLSQKVQYKNRRRTRVMLEGWVTREGIHCGCCSKILTVSKFELHAGSKLRQPYQNIFLESGITLLQCQIDAWNRQEGSAHVGFHSVDADGDDPNDDTCGICGDGGDLICCDGCPSTFHQSCLDIEILPPGDWRCPNCTCKYCGIATEIADEADGTIPLLSCTLCEKKYHESCVKDISVSSVDSNLVESPFCGQSCKELFECLQKNVGIKHDLEGGFSWSLTRRTDDDSKITCNAKLAVAMTVMDECFLPIVDRRSGINLIRNALYSTGSNFNRLSYGGFYTAILERGDEIISAASIRFHGTKLAEMPFIGTRHIYRRQGMCRRLFSAIESSLSCLKVEKLIIPAISELTHTWTEVFGFTPIEESLKHEMKSMNMLVFPGIDMLQKLLGGQEHEAKDTTSESSDSKQSECEEEQCSKPEVADKPDTDLIHANETEEVAEEKTDLPIDNSMTRDILDDPLEFKDPDLIAREKTDLPMDNSLMEDLLDDPLESKDPDLIAEENMVLPTDNSVTGGLLDDPLEPKDPDLIAEERTDLPVHNAVMGDLLDLESQDLDSIAEEKTDLPDDISVTIDPLDDPLKSKGSELIAEEKAYLLDDNLVTRDLLDDPLELKGTDLISGTESSNLPSGAEISEPAIEGQNSFP